jgi:hypothetical protein
LFYVFFVKASEFSWDEIQDVGDPVLADVSHLVDIDFILDVGIIPSIVPPLALHLVLQMQLVFLLVVP